MNHNDPALQVAEITRGGQPALEVAGEIDLRTSPQLRSRLLEAPVNASRPLIIDLSKVPYMDSSGVGTLVFAKREIERRGGKVVLFGLQPRVRSVFEITHLEKFFTIVDNEEDLSE